MITVKAIYNDSEISMEFPCDEKYLYAKLKELQIPDESMLEPTLYIKKVEDYEELSALEETFVDLDELNYLAKRLDSLDYEEINKFNAVVQEFGMKNMTDFINLTFNMQYYTLIQDMSSVEKIGKVHMLTRKTAMSEKEMLETDFAKIGKQLMESGNGRLTQYGLLFLNDDLPYGRPYNRKMFPLHNYEDKLLTVSLEYVGKTAYVYLPEIPFAIDKAIRRLGAETQDACIVKCIDFGAENADWYERLKAIAKDEGVYQLNEVAEEINELPDVCELRKLTEIIEFARKNDSGTIAKLAKNIDEFTFYPDVIDEDELGRALIEENEDYRIHEDIADFFMFEQYAESMISVCDCKFTENGVVLLKNKTLTEILGEEQNNAMTMGGM